MNDFDLDELLDSFETNSVNGVENDDPKIKELANRYIDNFETVFKPRGIGLHIYGEIGCGKTFLAQFIKVLAKEKGINVHEFHAMTLLDINFNNFIEITKENDLIIIDDLDISTLTSYQISKLLLIIDTLYRNLKPVIITSNESRSDLDSKDRTRKRIYDRWTQMTHPVFIDHPPRRREISRKRMEEIDNLLDIKK